MKRFGKAMNVALSLVLVCGLLPIGGTMAFADELATDVQTNVTEPVTEKVASSEGVTVEKAAADDGLAELAQDGVTTVSVGTTGGGSAEVSVGGTHGEQIEATAGQTVTVTPAIPEGCYLAQVRYATVEPATQDAEATTGPYTALKTDGGTYSFVMPDQSVRVFVDYVSIVWDGTMDVTWYNAEDTTFYLSYPAQYEGLAAIVNGLFNCYPTVTVIDDEGTGASHEVPSYALYQKAMGMVIGEGEGEASATYPNNLYGEFTSTYQLTDTQGLMSQSDYTRTDPMTVTQRLVGDANAVHAITDTSDNPNGPNGQNLTTTADYWYGADGFNSKTIYIMKDLDFGAWKTSGGKWDYHSPLFMPVGGQISILPGREKTNGYAKLSSSFNGTLDGLGHSFSNVYCERYANSEFGDSQSCGLVGRLGNHDNEYNKWIKSGCTEGYPPAVNPTVRQIVFESGYISARRTSGAIVGKIGHTSATELRDGTVGGVVEYCINKATVYGTDKKGISGIVGAAWNDGVIRYCANFGNIIEITGGSGFLAAGIAGSCEMPVVNCYNVGTVYAGAEQYSEAIGTDNGGAKWNNCYYLSGSDGNSIYPGVYKGTGGETVHAFGVGEETTSLTASLLNNGGSSIWIEGKDGINSYDGVDYPILYFQDSDYNPAAVFSVTVEQPEEGGTIEVSAASGLMADQITLSCTPVSGWTLDHYVVNGRAIDGDSFALDGETTVTAVLRQLSTSTVSYESSEDDPYTFVVTKTGTIDQDGVSVKVVDYPVASGDMVYEDDALSVVATLKDGVTPADENLVYTGEFTYQVFYPNYPTTQNSTIAIPYTVKSTDENLFIKVNNAKTVYKNWSLDADTSWYDETGATTEYTITTPQQLAGVAKLVNSGVTTFEGVTLTLGNDISLANPDGTTGVREWSPIGRIEGSVIYDFSGTFDGAGYSITDMSIAHTVSGAIGKARGLFGCTSGATIENVNVSGTITSAAGNICGGLIGQCTGENLVSDCSSSVNIAEGASLVGGLVGKAAGTDPATATRFVSCSFDGFLTAALATADGVGGIVGYAEYGVIEDSAVDGTVALKSGSTTCSVGGFAGQSRGVSFTRCVFGGTLNCLSTNGYVGGLSGKVDASSEKLACSVSECMFEGTISGKGKYVGGLMGYLKGRCDMADCAVTGKVTYEGTATNIMFGGLVGYFTNSATDTTLNSQTAKNCYVASELSYGTVGAVVGYYDRGAFATENVYYLEDITTTQYAKKGTSATSSLASVAKSSDNLKALAPTLGSAWVADDFAINGGYPVLARMTPSFTVADQMYTIASGMKLVTYSGRVRAGQCVFVSGVAMASNGGVYQCLLSSDRADAITPSDFSLQEGSVSKVALRDANGNGRVNVIDAQVAYDVAAGRLGVADLGVASMLACDVNADGTVDASDALAIQHFVHFGE